jgi:hypothetical protein
MSETNERSFPRSSKRLWSTPRPSRRSRVSRGFERLGKMAKRARRGYPIGWAYVLGLYGERTGPFMMLINAMTAALMRVHRSRQPGSRA